MQKILTQIYNGELSQAYKYEAAIEKLKENEALSTYEDFLKKLPVDLKEEFEQLIDTHFEMLADDLKQSFFEGFRIGTRLMAEVYSGSEEF